MELLLKEAITRSGRTELEFFQSAYLWRFQKIATCVDDVCQYRLHAVIPKYIQEYLKHKFDI